MSQDDSKQPESKILEQEAQARREFLKKAGAIGVTAPAVALLMSAKPARAQVPSPVGTAASTGDDP